MTLVDHTLPHCYESSIIDVMKKCFTTLLSFLLLCGGRLEISSAAVLETDVPNTGIGVSAAEGSGSSGPGQLTRETSFLTDIRQLTFEGRRAGEGYFAVDGSQLVFQSERFPGNPFFQIYRMDLSDGQVTRVSPGVGKTSCAWMHPSEAKILFASTHEDPAAKAKQKAEIDLRSAGKHRRYSWDFAEHYDIFETSGTGSTLSNLTRVKGYDAEGAWSPDGRSIVFASNRHAYTEQTFGDAAREKDLSLHIDIYIMNSDGSGVHRLTTTPGYDGGPFFSPDGTRIVWRRFSLEGSVAEVWTMRTDGSDQRQITSLSAMSWAPFYHPSGDYIIFTTNRHGHENFELYIVDAEGESQPVRVTTTAGFDGLPSFHPDGATLSWTSTRGSGDGAQIFLSDWNDEEARCMLGLEPVAVGPSRAVEQCLLRRTVSTLASKTMAGRMTGSAGEIRATAFAASLFKEYGLKPAGDNGTYFQEFEFTAGVSLGSGNRLALEHGSTPSQDQKYLIDQDWRPLSFSRVGDFQKAGIVFAGYGIVAPKTDSFPAYDSFDGLEVAGKWVLVFRYLPERIEQPARQRLQPYSSLRHKAMAARDKGALGIIVVTGPNAVVKDELVRLVPDASLSGTSIGVLSVTNAVAEKWMSNANNSLKSLQDDFDAGKSRHGFELPVVQLTVSTDIIQQRRTGRNVLAVLEAGGRSANTGNILGGAHIDHLGDGLGNGSLARGDEKGLVHFGADDNASGVAAVLEIARALAAEQALKKQQMRRSVTFALWSGEEMGLLGSSHYAKKLSAVDPHDLSLSAFVSAYLNMDMVGRLRSRLVLQGVGSSSNWKDAIERQNVPVGLSITLQDDSYLPTDAMTFYLRRVPILNAFTGGHTDYHSPRDTADKINYQGLAQIARFMTGLTRELMFASNTPDYIELERPKLQPGAARMRVYLGTIPDYAGETINGVRLAGAAKGGPAETAGIAPGDVVVELAGKKVENIYDYTYIVSSLAIGTPVPITVIRNGEHRVLMVTPGSRD